MILNTRRLFTQLLPAVRIDAVCDIGSMDGAEALTFRAAAPHSRIYAFEPNPTNFRFMAEDPALRERNIEVLPLAVTDHDGEAEFFLVDADYSRSEPRRGMSSLYSRPDEWAPSSAARVGTTRLDTFLSDRCPPDVRLALWIDAEGVAYEVIEGVSGVAERVQLIHAEVETSPCIGPDQKLYPEVKALLGRLGFTELATDLDPRHIQFNALFVRLDLPLGMRLRVKELLVRARLRRLVGGLLGRWCPGCLRRYQAMRPEG